MDVNNAVKMFSDSQSLSSIPSNLLVYVLRIVKMYKLYLKMITPGNSSRFKKALIKSDV